MGRSIASCLILLLLNPYLCYSVPSITDITFGGDLDNDTVLTIAGSDFDTKSTAAPVTYEDVDSGSFSGDWQTVNELTVNADNNRNSNSSNNGTLDFDGVNDGDGYITGDNDKPGDQWFIKYWFKIASTFDWGTTTNGGGNHFLSNVKVLRLWSKEQIDENFVIQYQGWTNSIVWTFESIEPEPTGSSIFSFRERATEDVWHSFKLEYVENSAVEVADGSFKLYFDGNLMSDETGLETRQDDSETKRALVIGFAEVWGLDGEDADDPNDFYIDDVYYDNFLQRIEVSTNSTWALTTETEMCIPSAWGDTEITCSFQEGSWDTDSDTLYVYVFDESGDVNSSGFELASSGGFGLPKSMQIEGSLSFSNGVTIR